MKRTVFLLFIALVFCASASALEVPDRPSFYVNDYAAMLSSASRGGLEERLAGFDRETSNQIVVAIFPSLEGASLEDFSIRLAEKWKPGDAKKDNGVLLLVFRDDRAVRIETGYGLEGALPDALAKRIIENEIVPRFKQGDFDGGVTSAVEAIMQATRGEYKSSSFGEDKIDKAAPWIIVALILYMLLPPVCYLLITTGLSVVFGPGGFAMAILTVVLLEALRKAASGVAGKTYSGRRGGWYSPGPSGGWSGGGFSGGGGGFGGGGASGRW